MGTSLITSAEKLIALPSCVRGRDLAMEDRSESSDMRLNSQLLALKVEGDGCVPRKVGTIQKLEKSRKWVFSRHSRKECTVPTF